MSSRRAHGLSRGAFIATALLLMASLGCFEQWSESWFPQMKWQKAVQAYEVVQFDSQVEGFVPPEGTVPVTGGEAEYAVPALAKDLENPRPMSMASLNNGEVQYQRYCATCHGENGMGDGPVSMTGDIRGPIGGVLALNGPASVARVYSDGHIYAAIRNGVRRMPGYARIPVDDRWDIVNYLRYLNGQKGVGQ